MTHSNHCHSKISPRCFLFITSFLLLLADVSTAANQSPVTLTFGIIPQQSASKMAEKWTPVISYLSAKTGYQILFKTAKNITIFKERCGAGEYDLAYVNPYLYTVFHQSPGYQVFAKQKLTALKGIIVVRKDSSYQDLQEFSGKTLAFPSPDAFAASIIPQAHLSEHGIAFSPQYVSSHDSVFRAVALGLFPAGGGVPRTFQDMDLDVREQLRVLWTSKGYPPHAIAAHPRVATEIVKKVVQAMVEMDKTTRGKKLLETIKFKGIVPADNAGWDDVRGIKGTLTH